MMRLSRKFIFTVAVFGLSSLTTKAADPSTQPAMSTDALEFSTDPTGGVVLPPPTSRATADDVKPRHRDRLRPGLRYMQPYGDKERNDAMQFMSQHSPQRFKFIDGLPEGEKKTGVQNFAIRAYQSWMQLGKTNFPLYAVVLKRVEAEDEIFGLVSDLREASADKQSAITSKIHEKVEHLVDIGMKERQMRLDDLMHTLKEEQQKLDEDNADRKVLVEKRLKSILADDHLGGSSFK